MNVKVQGLLKRLRHWGEFLQHTPGGQKTLRAFSLVFTAGLVAYLGYQLTDIGWQAVLQRVPRTPWFYLFFVLWYFCPAAFEALVFRLLWRCPARRSLPALLKKRVYSKQLLDYSGEAYLYLWARRYVDLPPRKVLHTIKDNLIISSSTSTIVALVTLLLLLFAGQIALPPAMLAHDVTYVVAGGLVGVSLVLLGVKFRHRILSLPPRLIPVLFGLHLARLVGLLVLQLLLWSTVDPTVPLRSWLSLLSVEIVISRIPFMPNKDFVLLGTGLEVAGALDVALPLLAGMLLTTSVLEKLLNLLFFGIFSVVKPVPVRTSLREGVLAGE